MKTKRKEFIKKAHAAACSDWKEKIEGEFPKLFKGELKVGDWLIADWAESPRPMKISSIDDEYYRLESIYLGLDCEGKEVGFSRDKAYRKATSKEVEKHLIEEAKKRGVWNVPNVNVDGRVVEDSCTIFFLC